MSAVTTDVLVVGGGAAGLLAATTARQAGLDVILVEADDILGGSAAATGGTLWLPGVAVGERGPGMAAEAYLKGLYGTDDPRRSAFVARSPRLFDVLTEVKAPLTLVRGEPDAHPEETGGRRSGRVYEPEPADAGRLGAYERFVRLGPGTSTLGEQRQMLDSSRNPIGAATAVKVFGGRSALGRLAGRQPVVGGSALVVGLVVAAAESGVSIWRGCPLLRLTDDARTAVVLRGGAELEVSARRGIVLASGGFSHDGQLRAEHLGHAADVSWSASAPKNDGVALRVAEQIGAATGGFGSAEWRPSMILSDGTVRAVDLERCLPYSILVDAAGTRFTNEALPGVELGQAMVTRDRDVRAVPCYLVLDSRHRTRFPLGPWPPRMLTTHAIRTGEIARADSLNDLAAELAIDKAGLIGTVARFNRFARTGVDEDFHRGASARDLAHGAAFHRPNRSMGSVEKPPFYGIRIFPSESNTRGGLVTDERARVLRPDGSVVDGVYAVGAAAQSPWGGVVPGSGASLAFGLVSALVAAEQVSS